MLVIHNLLGAVSVVFVLAFALYWCISQKWSAKRLSLPPGPKPLPFIGNLLQVPRDQMGYTVAKWTPVYGDVIYMRIFGREFVVLNSARAALDLFYHRGAMYSARPHLTMAGELVGRRNSVLFRQYDDVLKDHRKLLHNALNARRIGDYEEMLEIESLRLLSALQQYPSDFISHLRRNAGSMSLQIAYGYKVPSYTKPDHFIHLAEKLARITTESSEPGRWLVDSFPWLQHIPDWFPGASFKAWARTARSRSEEFTEAPYLYAKKLVNEGKGADSFTTESTDLLERESGRELGADEEYLVKWAAASIYAGGSDTTVALTAAFFLYMAVFPEVQARAQAELDAVIGTGRLTMLQDQEYLPYIDALIKELHRFNPIVPLIPHSTLTDDEYRGYRIPKGSWIMANTCAIMHDPSEFPDPSQFKPGRYLDGSCKTDPKEYSFGFGRRRCPGLNFANASIFITVTHVLSLFTISAPRDKAGNKHVPDLAFTAGHVSHPEHFQVDIKPRSPVTAALLKQLLMSKGEALTSI